jgi:hypothetical protein
MRFSEVEKCLVTVALKARPFNAGILADEVRKVLEHGNSKHADDRATAREHVQHAVAHLQAVGTDSETKLSHRAHAAARLILALIEICKPSDRANARRF